MNCLEVYSIMEIQNGIFDDCAIVSIVSPGMEHPKIIGEFTEVLPMSFYDVIEELYVDDNKVYDPMSAFQAEEIIEFLKRHLHKLRWVIHCEAGVSRSAGVALGIATLFSTVPGVRRLEFLYPFHNKYVRRVIEDIGRRRV